MNRNYFFNKEIITVFLKNQYVKNYLIIFKNIIKILLLSKLKGSIFFNIQYVKFYYKLFNLVTKHVLFYLKIFIYIIMETILRKKL